MPRLFTYIIPSDDGAAPNPFNGMCSLAICKPVIRRVAKPGDWVAGIGSKNPQSGRDLSSHLVYAMCIEQVISLREYDQRARACWPHRIPNIRSYALQDSLGDCIYDYSNGSLNPVQRRSVHNVGNATKDFKDFGAQDHKDLRGKNVLLSFNKFYYFGNQAIPIAPQLADINPHKNNQTQGHRSYANAKDFDNFIKWIETFPPGQHGWPDHMFELTCGGCTPPSLDDNKYVCLSRC